CTSRSAGSTTSSTCTCRRCVPAGTASKSSASTHSTSRGTWPSPGASKNPRNNAGIGKVVATPRSPIPREQAACFLTVAAVVDTVVSRIHTHGDNRMRRLTRYFLCAWIALGTTLAAAQDEPFVGVVVEDRIELRAGAGGTFYVVGHLTRGQTVNVAKVEYGWNKIVPPQGVYSYIAKGFVNRQGDGSTGVVTRDRAAITAAGIGDVSPGDSYRRQVEAKLGDKVQIVGEAGDYYRIQPPPGAYVFAPPGSIRRA